MLSIVTNTPPHTTNRGGFSALMYRRKIPDGRMDQVSAKTGWPDGLLVMCEPELTNRRPWGADVEQANAPLEPEDTRQRLPPPDPHAQLRSGSISPVLERESPPSAASCGIHLTCTRQCESQSRIVTEQSLRKGNCLC